MKLVKESKGKKLKKGPCRQMRKVQAVERECLERLRAKHKVKASQKPAPTKTGRKENNEVDESDTCEWDE